MSTAPRRLGKYELQAPLGEGGMAEVWKAFDTQLQRYIAIKLLHANLQADPDFVSRFTREAQMIASLRHPNIVQIYDFHISEASHAGTSGLDTIAYMVMEYIKGSTLADYIYSTSRKKQFPPAAEIIRLFTPISLAIDYAHAQGMIHRDIKPSNILLDQTHTTRNSMGEPILSDFGLAKVLTASSQTLKGVMMGTPLYISPEQVQNRPVSKQADLYALGVMLYEVFTGGPPFQGDSLAGIMMQHVNKVPTDPHLVNSELPPALSVVLLKSLAKEPENRFPSASALTAAVAGAFRIPIPEDLKQASSAMDDINLSAEQTLLPGSSPVVAFSSEETSSSLSANGSKLGGLTSQQGTSSQLAHPWNIHFARNPFFTGRSQLLEQLHEEFHLNQPLALSGLGGIGKTQMAIEYVYRYRAEYSAVFWVRADSRETLVADFVGLARLLNLPERDAQDQMLIVSTVKRWMEEQEGWLLILDNADELRLLTDFLPGGGKGHILLTTRAQATGRIARCLSVEKLELSESMQLVLRRAKLLGPREPLDNAPKAVREEAKALIAELDGLPLAIDQAGAYLEETGCSLAEYLALYRRRRLALLKRQSSVSTDYPHTVASTWGLSFQQVEQADPAAAELLRLCAFLHPDDIPEDLITEGAEYLGPVLQEVAVDPLLLNDAIQLLRRYSLLKRDPKTRQLDLHRLVQVVLKESLDSQAQRQWAERAVRVVNAAFPEVEFANWDRCELYLPHAQVCAQLINEYHLSFPEIAHLLHAVGHYLYDRGQYTQAEPLLQQALTIREQVLGPDHPEVASTLNDLVELYWYQGKYQQAEPLVQRALAIREQVLGPDHPQTATSLNDLSSIYISLCKYTQAEPILQRALALREKALGANHSDVAESLNNLAYLYMLEGKYAEAEPLLLRAVALQEHSMGPEHPVTLLFLANLANLYTFRGKYSEAEPLYQRILAGRERVLGPEHPYTAVSIFNLAQFYYLQGKYEQAESLMQRALTIHEHSLGPEHTRTMYVLLYLAQIYQAQSQYEQAESLYQRVLANFEHSLGPEHPYVAETLTNLARLYALQGHNEQVEPLYQRALTIGKQALGADHPSVAQTLHHLGQFYALQGRVEQAKPLFQRTLTIREQALGFDHPDTITTREALTTLLQKQQGQQILIPQSEGMSPA